jgi:hypothetical protein
MDAPCFLYTDDTVYGKYFDAPIGILLLIYYRIFVLKGPSIGSPLLFIHGVTRVKNLFFAESGAADREPLAFCTRCYACKNHVFC